MDSDTLLFISFLSALYSSMNSCCNSNLDFFCLVGSVANSGVASSVGISFTFFYWT